MKEKMLDWIHSGNKKEIFYWVHFMLFFISNTNVKFVNYVRAAVMVMYLFAFIYMTVKNPKFEHPPNYILLLFGGYIILNALIIKNLSVHIIYTIVTFLIIKELKFSKSDILSLVNKTAIVYFILSIILNYTPVNFLAMYDTRLLENKIFPNLYRFLGIEGTPAGADIFYILVFLSNIFLNKNKSRFFYITLSVIVLIWASSFSPVVSILGALLILPFSNNKLVKITYSSMLWLYQFIIIIVYSFAFENINHILNIFSTWRAGIWFNSTYALIHQFSISHGF